MNAYHSFLTLKEHVYKSVNLPGDQKKYFSDICRLSTSQCCHATPGTRLWRPAELRLGAACGEEGPGREQQIGRRLPLRRGNDLQAAVVQVGQGGYLQSELACASLPGEAGEEVVLGPGAGAEVRV